MFLGQYEHSIDDKGRMTIPFRYRELLSEGAYITRGFDQNLMVLTAASFQRMSTRINQQSITDPNARALKRMIFAHADAVDVDKVGRILIPQYLRDDALLKDSAMVIGVSDHFEIWAPALWVKQLELLDNPEVNSARYSYLDLTTE
jgi:MraZ protein